MLKIYIGAIVRSQNVRNEGSPVPEPTWKENTPKRQTAEEQGPREEADGNPELKGTQVHPKIKCHATLRGREGQMLAQDALLKEHAQRCIVSGEGTEGQGDPNPVKVGVGGKAITMSGEMGAAG